MRIYIAEDDPSVISILEEIIESCGLGEVCGSSGETAADPLYIAKLDPDIVLADFLMPELDGVSLVRELKSLGCPARCRFPPRSLSGGPMTRGLIFLFPSRSTSLKCGRSSKLSHARLKASASFPISAR